VCKNKDVEYLFVSPGIDALRSCLTRLLVLHDGAGEGAVRFGLVIGGGCRGVLVLVLMLMLLCAHGDLGMVWAFGLSRAL
jgi:hypothetical protein